MVDPVKKQTLDDTELRNRPNADATPAPTPKAENPATEDKENDEAERAKLQDQLRKVDGWTARLHDPELGGVGLAFQKATAGILTSEDFELDMKPSAGYHSFVYPPNPGQKSFVNHVLYGTEALQNAERLLGARTHEFVHALQYQSAAALHADPFNDANNVIVSPYDYVLRKERLEQDAYVTGAWLCALAADAAPDIVKVMEGSPLPVSTFSDIRAKSATLQDAFETAARDCRNLEGFWSKDAEKTRIADEWHARALDEYDRLMKHRFNNLKDGESMTIVRLDGRDIREIGASFGPNTFGNDDNNPALTQIENLSAANAKKLAEIEAKYGIAPREQLPTLQDTIMQTGSTRAAFLAASKSHKGAEAPHPAANDAAHRQNTGARPPSP